ncbi:MAG TPA: copper resistance protein CopC [Nitrosopumilaceae archaeon]|nr:copper resistance protein CopC [Nitrosopumilaceae archaeon]
MTKFNGKLSFQIILIIVIISSIIFAIPNIPNSYAHAFVTKSDPAQGQSLATQPSKIDVYFSDPVDIRYSQLKVLDSDGNEIQEKDQHYIDNDQTTLSVSLPSGLKDGIYTITTKVLDQTDGHVTEDAIVFAIGQAVPQNFVNPTSSNYQEISIPEAITRFPALVGQVMVVGISFATLWLWKPLSRIQWLETSLTESRIKIDVSMMKLAVIGSVIILSSGFAMIAVQAYSINAGILDAISTKFGNIWVIRMISSVTLLVLSFVILQKIKKSNFIVSRVHVLGLFGMGLVVLATTSLISHGAATGKILPLILDFIHNVVASLWIGGIFYIAFIVMPKLKLVNENVGVSTISILIPRFSIIAITILGAIVITGPFLLYSLENNLALTLASTYGKILIVKLSLAAAMIAIGAYNQMIIHKQAFNTTNSLTTKNRTVTTQNVNDTKSILSKFTNSAKIESLIGIALIASVAVLVDSGVPSSEFQNQLQSIQDQNIFALATLDNTITDQKFSETKFVENGSRIILTINPFFTGNNDFKISFLDSNKNPIDMKSVQLRLTQVDKGIGPITINAQQVSTGIFSVNTAFGFPGHWNARIEGIQNKENSLNLVASYDDLLVKPNLSSLTVNIKEFKMPENNSRPLYPAYDNSRNVVWIGDNNSKIFEFDLNSKKFIEHKINGINIISAITLDSQHKIWYTDPISKIIGNYDPSNNSNQIYKIPSQGTISGITIDDSDNVWLIDASNDKVLKFNPITKNFTSINLENGSQPLGITMEKSSGQIWIAEGGIGKIASIDPNNYKINEYAPTENNVILATPTGIISDPVTGNIYVSEHDGYAVSVFNPLLKTFKKITLDLEKSDLPLGMVFDNYHNLWVAQHTLDKIAVMDPRTGEFREFDIPTKNTWVQWLTVDSQGNIVMAEYMSGSLGIISTNVNPALTQDNSQTNNLPAGIPRLGFSYADMVAPSMAGLLIVVAFFYSKSVTDLKNSIRQIKKNTD